MTISSGNLARYSWSAQCRRAKGWPALALLVGGAMLTVMPISISDGDWLVAETLDALHLPAGMALFVLVKLLLPVKVTGRSRSAAAVLVAVALAIGLEMAQSFTGRSVNVHDGIASSAGVLLAALLDVVSMDWRSMGRRAAFSLVFLTVVGTSASPVLLAWAHFVRLKSDPIITSFKLPGEAHLWMPAWGTASRPPHMALVPTSVSASGHALLVDIQTGGWSGVQIYLPSQERFAHSITVDVTNPGSPFTLWVQAGVGKDASAERRLDQAFVMESGRNHLVFPAEGSADVSLRGLRRLLLYVKADAGTRSFLLDKVSWQ